MLPLVVILIGGDFLVKDYFNNTYCRCTLHDYFWDEASQRVAAGNIYERSHRGEEANEVGFLGEVVAEKWFQRHDIHFKDMRTKTTHDYLLFGSSTIDVKTKDRTVLPRIDYDNSVPLYNHDHQRPDYYLFISLVRDKSIPVSDIRRYRTACIVGGIDIETLDFIGKDWEAGETDARNGTKFWTACRNIEMSQLIPTKEIVRLWKKDNTMEDTHPTIRNTKNPSHK